MHRAAPSQSGGSTPGARHLLLGLAAIAIAFLVTACASTDQSTTDATPTAADPSAVSDDPDRIAEYPMDHFGGQYVQPAGTQKGAEIGPIDLLRGPEARSLVDEVEVKYAIGPAVARRLGYRVDWQYPSAGTTLRKLTVDGDSVFTLDELNFLTRLRRQEGDRLWRIPTVLKVERIYGINYAADVSRVFATLGSHLLEIDAASGALLDKQDLRQIANTAPVTIGPFLVYGSRNGQVVWHSYTLDAYWRGYEIANSIWLPPIYSDGFLVVAGSDGHLMSLEANTARQVWSRRTLAPVVARPAAADGVAFIASLDQHIRAFDIAENRAPLWQYLTESPLDQPPTVIGDQVYQQVPSEGLVCFEAQPFDSPGGVVVWSAADVTGNVVARHGSDIITWDEQERRLVVLDERYGTVAEALYMPHLQTIVAGELDDGDLFAVALDGRVTRLVPRR